ncbi:MAG: hypothetical protein RIF33_13530 [Cyclobacteriaceae bacterium]
MDKLIDILTKKEAKVIAGTFTFCMLLWSIIEPSTEAYFTCAAFSIAFVISLVVRRTNNNDLYYESSKSNLEEIEKHRCDLKPYTALEQLESFISKFDDQHLSDSNKQRILSRFHYLKGQCILETSKNKSDGFEQLIKAYKLDHGSMEIKERAVTSLYHLNEISEAQSLSERLLEEDPYNARAWVVQVLTKLNNSIDSGPPNVLKKTDFKFILSSFLINQKNFSEVKKLVQTDLNDDFNKIDLDHLNFRYYLQLALFCYNDFFGRSTLFVDLEKNLDFFENSEITEINQLLDISVQNVPVVSVELVPVVSA